LEISITIEGQFGLNWNIWKRLAEIVEAAPFYGLYRSDHFSAQHDALDAFVSLAYLASHTRRVHFGTLVAPVSFREPVMMARQAMHIDALSGGRLVLGVGAGWEENEHAMFGYPLGDMKTRMDRLEEGLQVLTGLLRSEEPVTFNGKFYQLKEARLLPRPNQPTRLMVGGKGPKRSMPIVAKYADIWNCHPKNLEHFSELNARLDELLVQQGRQPGDVKRTVMVPVLIWETPADLKRMMDLSRKYFFGEQTDEAILGWSRENMGAIIGDPVQVAAGLRQYQEAGVDECIIQWFIPEDIANLEYLANAVLPHFTQQMTG
jgi:alkanesulfonate monooxygenase SsuD/methylene tetrahydromethanopterin reductase-like flavin-dependent oxidoreductase (luciferase family)